MCFSHMYVHRCLLISAFHLLMTPDCHLYIHIHHIAPHVRPITVYMREKYMQPSY